MNKKVLIALIVAIALVATGAIGFTVVKGIMIKSDPTTYLLYSMTHNTHTAMDSSFSSKFKVDDEALGTYMSYYTTEPEAMAKFVTKMISRISINGDVKTSFNMDDKKLALYESIDLSYAGKSLFDVNVNLQDEQFMIGSNVAMEKPLSMTKDELYQFIEDQSGVDLSGIKLDKYIEVFNMENDSLYKAFVKDSKGYEKILRKHLDDFEKSGKEKVELKNGKEVKCDIIEGSLSINTMIELYIDIMEEAKTDKELKALAKGKTIELLELVISSKDYEVLGLEKADIEVLIESVESDFDATYEEGIDLMIETYNEMLYTMSAMPMDELKYKFQVAIDSHYDIRQVKFSMDYMGFGFEQTMTMNAFDKDVKFDKMPKSEDTIKIVDMMNDPAVAEQFGVDLAKTGVTNMLQSEAVNTLMADLETDSEGLSEETRQSILDLVQYFTENKDMLLDMMLESMEP